MFIPDSRVPPVDICDGISLMFLGENLQTIDILSTTYLPRFVNIVCERLS